MNNEERIIRYLDNDLPDIDRNKFEADLKTNLNLKELFDEFLRLNSLINESKKTENIDPDYFINIIPRFREGKIKTKKYFLIPKLAFVLIIIFVLSISYILINTELIFNSGNHITISEISDELADSDIDGILRYIDEDNESYNYDQLPVDYLENDLAELINQIPETELNSLADVASNDISSEFSAEEADKIYEALINKNFRNEVKL